MVNPSKYCEEDFQTLKACVDELGQEVKELKAFKEEVETILARVGEGMEQAKKNPMIGALLQGFGL